jgi:branched-chain amino acid transport system permease protein
VSFFISYLVLAEIYILVALSTNILVGVIGIFSLSQAAIFGVGAYVVAILTTRYAVPFELAMVSAASLSVGINILSALPSLRVAGDYFVVTSFGIQLLASAIFLNMTAITGGPAGFPGIPAPVVFGIAFSTPQLFLLLASSVVMIGCIGFWLVMRSPFGRLMHSIREDEVAVAASGKHVLNAKVSAAGLAGLYAGVAGGLYAGFMSFIDPTLFDLEASILFVTMVVLGGARTLWGSIVGALFLLGIPQLLQYIDIPLSIAAPARQMIYGLLLVLFVLYRPQGLVGQRL